MKEAIVKLQDELMLATNSNNSKEFIELSNQLIAQMGYATYRHNTLGLRNSAIARILYYTDLYKKIVNTPGVICEFGVQYGATLNLLLNLRSIFEPYNRSRIVYGFDTFEGFPSTELEDGQFCNKGDYSVPLGYEKQLERLLALQESFAPMNEVKKFQLIKGNATNTIDTWLESNPHAIISMAIFDMDIYQPTKDCLSKIIPRLTKGSLLVFDELNCDVFPGETLAVNEVLGLNNLRLQKSPFQPYGAWAIFGE